MKEIIIEVPDGFGKTLKPEKVNCEIKGEIVRCGDCKHQNEHRIGSCPYYTTWGSVAPDDWFCAGGKRK